MYNYREESVKRIRERIERSGVPADAVTSVTRSQVYDLVYNTMTTSYKIETKDGTLFSDSSLELALAQYFRELAKIVFSRK
jgi:hypothetical protein